MIVTAGQIKTLLRPHAWRKESGYSINAQIGTALS